MLGAGGRAGIAVGRQDIDSWSILSAKSLSAKSRGVAFLAFEVGDALKDQVLMRLPSGQCGSEGREQALGTRAVVTIGPHAGSDARLLPHALLALGDVAAGLSERCPFRVQLGLVDLHRSS
jgi:hypothetical protein